MIRLGGMSLAALERRYRRWEMQREAEAARAVRAEQKAKRDAAAPRLEVEIAAATARRRAAWDAERRELAAGPFACVRPGAPGGANCPECHDTALARLHERHVAAAARWDAEVARRRANLQVPTVP